MYHTLTDIGACVCDSGGIRDWFQGRMRHIIFTNASHDTETAVGFPTTVLRLASPFGAPKSYGRFNYDTKTYSRTYHTGPDADTNCRFGLAFPRVVCR